ncbi:xanthine dehydrogenase, small subunit [Pseudomonas sp. GM84]|uniref:xanthine dehydrogenase small subunit n=1 Tax=Pseudomonas sp. GM84 TaxID=1144340 RepID=UPI00026FB57D|nr:xanthine dehydrogenase small subunit [Pseudomonas sp. GM84]EJN40344.1 xanthine dehydrogenase, small subunit [Pseudomonas sp. GM84]
MQNTPCDASPKPGIIHYVLNGEVQSLEHVDTTRSLLNHLREDRCLTGTKEGCAEGDCGACTVVVGELRDGELQMRTVNACIQFMPSLDGKAVFTVEHLRQESGALHPVQQAMVDCHGSQCGFCTPGFVMSLWSLYLEHEHCGDPPGREQIRSALTGNLCRCTGYRPILDAGEQMFKLSPARFESHALKEKLEALKRNETLVYEHEGRRFFAPCSLQELARLRAENPGALLLAGGTDIGLWVTKQFREIGDMISIDQVPELKRIERDGQFLRIGSGVSLTDSFAAIVALYPQLKELWERFASKPIRNAGTLGGNVANGSPIGDSMPALVALGARVVLHGQRGSRTLALEDLYTGYMRKDMHADELVEAVLIPLPKAGWQMRTYKLSKRFDSDISAVCAAFSIRLDAGHVVDCRVVYGGMAATVKRASQCEKRLIGKSWTEDTLEQALVTLDEDYQPLSDMRASAHYRQQCAKNLLYRFYLETRQHQPLPEERIRVFAVAEEQP